MEKAMIEAVAANQGVPGDVVGVGSRLPQAVDGAGFGARHGLDGPFGLYVDRIDENKGCRQLFDFLSRYRQERGSRLRLVLIGKAVIPIPEDAGIVHLEYEINADNPVPGMQRSFFHMRGILASMRV